MRDYLGQLALRVQQPEFAVQPRPVSRFESPRHSIFAAPELPASGEADELGSQFAVLIPAETSAGKLTPQADSRNRNESGTMDSLSEARPAKKSQKSYPGQSTAEPPIGTLTSGTEVTHQPLPEVGHPALSRRPAEQGERITRSAVAQAQPPVRIDRPAMPEPPIGTPTSRTEAAHQPLHEVGHPALSRRPAEQSERIARSAVAQVQPLVRIDRPEEQTGMASPDPSGRRELSELTEPGARREREWIRPLVRIENPEEKWASPLSPRAIYHGEIGVDSEPSETEPLFGRKADVMPKSGFAPVPGREIFKPLAEPTAPQFVADRVADAHTIQVTIGRVEIRATVASTPTRKTSAKSPVMSLDEYLRQRNGGRG